MSLHRLGAVLVMALLIGTTGATKPVRADPAVTGIVVGGSALVAYGLLRERKPPRDPSTVGFGAGFFDIVDGEQDAPAFRVEFRPKYTWRRVGTLFGLEATADGGFYTWGGLRVDMALGSKVIISPNLSVAGYQEGDGKDLGSSFQFRSGFDLFWHFDSGRIGLSFHHLSHAGLGGNQNPGAETLHLTYTIPLKRIL